MSDRESIAYWLERLADKHEARGETDLENRHYHRGTAIIYRARANDIRAEIDVAN
ncbi:hypothetical protein [Sphingopyxis flava]|uniref:Uncharacterized protein n=1 Tax=Sphingopyxis flava TaxID=1507287 RepID=A0A1T5CUY4_9SPHN|nr:hypothetical protein [Sphingopyxis flava]SKB63146.1 hypothetical protein SAMN06295937_1011134 [Sphingopyxis flava]